LVIIGGLSALFFPDMSLFERFAGYFSGKYQALPVELIIIYAVAALMCAVLTDGIVQVLFIFKPHFFHLFHYDQRTIVSFKKQTQPLDSGARTLLVLFMEAPAFFHKSQPEVYLHVGNNIIFYAKMIVTKTTIKFSTIIVFALGAGSLCAHGAGGQSSGPLPIVKQLNVFCAVNYQSTHAVIVF